MERCICLHGHFYQPPRENPWLEGVELQDSAYPYHDWNERITAECYAPNGAARVRDPDGRIERIVNNYARISFNFGPTLLSWMERAAPGTYRTILEADRESRGLYEGHGAALAQPYNHMILPLANDRDRDCQVFWGIRDFERRFGRRPEGMWLPECAVDRATLATLLDHGIRFTILGPDQARAVRARGGRNFHDVSGGRIDPSTIYEYRLAPRKSLALFFYDAPLARAVAFERVLDSGEEFAERLMGAFNEDRKWPQLVHVATDGESYGHHHRHGDAALAWALHRIEARDDVKLTCYGAWLARHRPTHEVQLHEPSSWSCAHGVERWKSDCGCNAGHAGWNQGWRAPLREALDWLRDALAPRFEAEGAKLLRDPWAARRDYIDVILDRSGASRDRFLAKHARRALRTDERVRVWKLLEGQRHAMLMYTSCGWFFDELSGIETVQVIQYAARAVQLGRELHGEDLEAGFLDRLERAKSNLPQHKDGRAIYEKFVRPAMVDLEGVAAHYAALHLFQPWELRARVHAFQVDREDWDVQEAGKARLAVGRVRVASMITEEEATLSVAVLHQGDHHLSGGVRRFEGEEPYAAMRAELREAFATGDLTGTARALDGRFPERRFSLKTLFRDEQGRTLARILDETLRETGSVLRRLHEERAPLVRFLGGLGMPIPRVFRAVGEFVLGAELRDAIDGNGTDLERIRRLLDEARQADLALDGAGLGHALQKAIEARFAALPAPPEGVEALGQLEALVRLARAGPLGVDLWTAENRYYDLLRSRLDELRGRAGAGDAAAAGWVEAFTKLGDSLGVRVG
jgi:alpha-amylase/alpha-mannosidase (GH57 family)